MIRRRSASSSQISSRESSTHSIASSTPYYERMEIQNNLLNEDIQKLVDSSQLSYTSNNKQISNSVRKTTDNNTQKGAQCVCNKVLAFNNISKLQDKDITNNNNNTCPSQEVFNIQLPYNINYMTKQDPWDSNFHPISLHSVLEYLLSDSKNILDLSGIGEVVWNFISVIYKSGWNSLITDKENKMFKQQVAYKFTPKIQETLPKVTN